MSIKIDGHSNLKRMGGLAFYGGSIGLVVHSIVGLENEPHLAPVLLMAMIFGVVSLVIYYLRLKKINFSETEKKILTIFLLLALVASEIYILNSYKDVSSHVLAVIGGTVINVTSVYHCFRAL